MFKRFQWTDSSEHRIAMTNVYEPLQPFLFLAFAQRLGVTTVIDVGANIGQYSIVASALPTQPVGHAFEAEEVAARQLAANVHLNGLESRLTVHGLAISDQARRLRFGVASAMAGNNGVLDTTFHDPSVYTEVRDVFAVALDDVLPLRRERIAMKIDIEGHEAPAIAGATGLLTGNDVIVQVEIYQPGEVEELLEGLGYTCLFAAGPDHYFANAATLQGDATVLAVIRDAIAAQIEYNLSVAQR